MKPTPALACITALHQKQRALWDRGGKLSQADRGRLLDIAAELESLYFSCCILVAQEVLHQLLERLEGVRASSSLIL